MVNSHKDSAAAADPAPSPWLTDGAPRRSVLTDEIYEFLKSKLMDNVVEPGSRLSIDGLSRDLGCSATPIREALARLESDGLVAKRPHYGYTAAPLIDSTTFDELFRMRLLLEPEALPPLRLPLHAGRTPRLTTAPAATAAPNSRRRLSGPRRAYTDAARSIGI